MTRERVIIVGGPRRGKSSLARRLRAQGLPTYCTDPESALLEAPEPGVTYLPEGLPVSGDDGAAQWVVDHWFRLPGPWVVEGWLTARALRRWKAYERPADRIIWMLEPVTPCTLRQQSLAKAVRTVWSQVAHRWPAITEVYGQTGDRTPVSPRAG